MTDSETQEQKQEHIHKHLEGVIDRMEQAISSKKSDESLSRLNEFLSFAKLFICHFVTLSASEGSRHPGEHPTLQFQFIYGYRPRHFPVPCSSLST